MISLKNKISFIHTPCSLVEVFCFFFSSSISSLTGLWGKQNWGLEPTWRERTLGGEGPSFFP